MLNFLLSPSGRVNRSQFWLFLLCYFTILVLLVSFENVNAEEPGFLTVLFVLAAIWPNLMLQIKRWHDRDKSGWWVLVGLIPVIGSIWILIENGLLPGTEGANRFGPPPA